MLSDSQGGWVLHHSVHPWNLVFTVCIYAYAAAVLIYVTEEQTDRCHNHHDIIAIIIIINGSMGPIQSLLPSPLDCLSSGIESYHTIKILFQLYRGDK